MPKKRMNVRCSVSLSIVSKCSTEHHLFQRMTRAALLRDRNRRSYVVLKDLEDAQKRKDRAKMRSGIR